MTKQLDRGNSGAFAVILANQGGKQGVELLHRVSFLGSAGSFSFPFTPHSGVPQTEGRTVKKKRSQSPVGGPDLYLSKIDSLPLWLPLNQTLLPQT